MAVIFRRLAVFRSLAVTILAVTTLAQAVNAKYYGKVPYYRFRPPGRQFLGGKITDDNPGILPLKNN